MSTHNIRFHGEIRKTSVLFDEKKAACLELCFPMVGFKSFRELCEVCVLICINYAPCINKICT